MIVKHTWPPQTGFEPVPDDGALGVAAVGAGSASERLPCSWRDEQGGYGSVSRPCFALAEGARLGPGRVAKIAVNTRRARRRSDGVGSLKSWQTMKEAYAVRRTVPPSAEIQVEIDKLLGRGLVDDPQKMLASSPWLGARLIIQRAVEEEFDSWLGRARYERKPNAGRGSATGSVLATLQTGEGELLIEIPQVREAAIPFVSKLFPLVGTASGCCGRICSKALVVAGSCGACRCATSSRCAKRPGWEYLDRCGDDLRGAA